MSSIEIISINTWKNEGEYEARMQLLARELYELKPQIVVCQECFSTEDNKANTLNFLAEGLKMNAVLTQARYAQDTQTEQCQNK